MDHGSSARRRPDQRAMPAGYDRARLALHGRPRRAPGRRAGL